MARRKSDRERDAAGLDREYEKVIEHLQATSEGLNRELERRFGEVDALKALLVANRTRRGRPLTEGGRERLLSKFYGATIRVSVAMCELNLVCTKLSVERDQRRLMTAWRMTEAA